MRASVAQQKKKEENKVKGDGASSSAPKAVGKGALKRKPNGKDDRPPKKLAVTVGDKSSKKLTPLRTGHGMGKGLMTSLGPVAQGPDRHLLMHKDYAIEMVGSIIRDKDVDPCVEEGTDELGASGLFDLTRVRFPLSLSFLHTCLVADGYCALQALVRMRALQVQDRGVAKERVVACLHKRIELLTEEEENTRVPFALLTKR